MPDNCIKIYAFLAEYSIIGEGDAPDKVPNLETSPIEMGEETLLKKVSRLK